MNPASPQDLLSPEPTSLDAARYPRTVEYLRDLPRGLASYPSCESKATIIRAAMEGHPLEAELGELPTALAEVLAKPPPASAWLPSVVITAAYHVIADRYYETDEEIIEWSYRNYVAMARSPMYIPLTMVASPAILLQGAVRRWQKFLRGTQLTVETRRQEAKLSLKHPAHLLRHLGHRTQTTAFRAAIEAAGGESVRSEILRSTPTCADYHVTWK